MTRAFSIAQDVVVADRRKPATYEHGLRRGFLIGALLCAPFWIAVWRLL